jgi:3-methyladenine DNA glycosylase AlkD
MTTQPSDAAADIAARLHGLSSHDARSLRRLRRTVSTEIVACSARQVIELAVSLLRERAPGGHVVACELVLHHPGALRAVRARDLLRMGQSLSSWGEVDTFACFVAGRAWRAGQVSDDLIADWARSPDRWWRRAALASTVPLNAKAQGGSGDAHLTLAICELLVRDRDDMVVKAMSWALRELAVRDAGAAAAFVDRHARVLPPRVVREVRNKLTTGLKSPRRQRRT